MPENLVQKLFILPCGYLNIDYSIFVTGKNMGKTIKAPVYSVLLIHDDGPILIDVGLNPDGLTEPEQAWGPRAKLIKPEFTKDDTIQERLRQLGLKVSDIKMVILTHLHWDHTGGLRFFENCPIIVQRAEYRFAFNPDTFVSAQYMNNHFDFPLNYQKVEGDTVIAPGISVIATPGHTPGHQSILVRLNSGCSYIIPGDAICLEENLKLKIPPSNNVNNEQAMRSIYRLEHLSKILESKIIPSHDIVNWDSIKKSPNFYS